MHDGAAVEDRFRLRRLLAVAVTFAVVVAGLVSFAPAERAEAAADGPKDAIAVLFSYTWNQIAVECETTLGPAGYGYVQTSPPQEHAMVPGEGNPWWIYYQPVSYKLESRMGTEAEFKSMVQRCDAAGVGVIVDAVINHMSGQSNGGTGWAGTQFQHYNYPGLYSDSDFHSCRQDISSYGDKYQVQNCNLVNLSDLDTGKASVQQTIADYLNRLADMGVKGFRFDAVKHISKEDMWGIWNRVTKKDELYVVQEVIRAAGEPIQPEDYIGIGDIHEFAYARKMKEAFGGTRIDWLTSGAGIGGTWGGFLQQKDAAVFVDNHDTERNGETLSYKNGKSYDLAQTFTLAWPYGSPSIHSGYEFSNDKQAPAVDGQGNVIDPQPGQNGWTFKHAQNDIKNMVGFRVATYGTDVVNKWSSTDGSAIAFGRGDKGFIAINNGSGQIQREFTTSLPDGTYYNVIKAEHTGSSWSGEKVTVSGGKFTATVGGKDAIALHVDATDSVEECTDSAAPSVPSNVKAAADGTTVTVTWNASTDDCAVTGYEIVRTGGAGSVTLTSTSPKLVDSGLVASTSYSYTVKAKDAAGKKSAASTAATAKTGDKPVSTATTVYYQAPAGWTSANIHYQVGTGTWTAVPGKPMTAVDGFPGWFQLAIEAPAGATINAAFNNGTAWDNNGEKNYAISSGGDKSVSGGSVASGKPVKADPLDGELSLYYKLPSGWSAVNAHYQVGTGAWTTAPGKPMAAVETCEAGTGWFHLAVDAGSAANVTVAFNNGSGTWDNNGGKNYTFTSKVAAVNGGAVSTADPCGTTEPEPTVPVRPTGTKAVPSGTSAALSWAAVPGATKYTVAYRESAGGTTKFVSVTGTAHTLTGLASGKEHWFKVRAENAAGVSAYTNATYFTTGSSASLPVRPTGMKAVPSGTSAALSWTAVSGATKYTVAYRESAGGTTKFVSVTGTAHTLTGLASGKEYLFKVRAENAAGVSAYTNATYFTTTGGATTVPVRPTGMKAVPSGTSAALSWGAVSGATKYTVAYRESAGGTTKFVSVTGTAHTLTGLAAGKEHWFKVRAENAIGASAYTNATYFTTGSGTAVPAVPSGVKATASGTSVAVSWTAVAGATKYTVAYAPSAGGTTKYVTATSPSQSVTGLTAGTKYWFKVRAENATGESAYSTAVTATTTGGASDEPGGSVAGATTGEPLGGDPREDSIYFIMTARWNDGVESNNMGGNMHVKSGNAANNDPMFRGDFQGIIDKLDYIKGLGFSAIWITPVVTNRSDYDFHGYHGWDFQRIDPRLETPGATYQELIDAAHAEGIKIYQDVVYNHTSRWGEKNLFTPTVYGKRDSEWSWYYDEKVPGKVYNPTQTDADGSTYNGDLWSETQPAGQNCNNWGVQSGYSAEGYKVYNCQWPNATSGMFPKDKFHPCWIGNWEGKDAQDCWIHEDLADLNTESAVVQDYLIDTYNKYIDMGVDGFRVDTAVHIPRVMWNRHFLPALQKHATDVHGEKGKDFYVFGEVAQFVHDKWNRGSVNHSAPFYTWDERREYSEDDVVAAAEQFNYENLQGPDGQPTSTNHQLNGNTYHTPDHSKASGMSIIDMRMHMNFDNASNAFHSGMDSDGVTNDATYNAVYVDSHDYGPGKSNVRFDGGTNAWAENMSLMWTFRGIPVLFYGSEIEFQAGKQIDCGPTCPLATTGRAYYGDNLKGDIETSDFGVVSSASGAVAATMQKPLVQHLQTLNRIRRAVPALQKGQYSTEGVSGNMAFKRRYTEGSVDSFVLVAVSGGASFSGIPNGTYVDAVTGDTKNVSNGSLTIAQSGQGNMRAYVLSLPGNPAPGKVGNGSPFLK